jgi:hypothetical protein
MSWEQSFVDELAKTEISNVFNPYRDRCSVHDVDAAAAIRKRNLEAVLERRWSTAIDSIWFGRDLGYRGGRRTGLALTDEVTMFSEAMGSGFTNVIARATHGCPVAERTAAVIWSVIERIRRPPLLWNAFPFHPHQPLLPFTNRAHTTREREKTAWAIEALVERFGKPKLIAIGNDASKALEGLGFAHETVRHPSYGGQREFIVAMERIHGLASAAEDETSPTLF